MNTRQIEAYLGFSYFLGIGPTRFAAIFASFEGVERAYRATYEELSRVIGSQAAHKFVTFRAKFNPTEEVKILQYKKIQIICQEDLLYPVRLKEISDPPICLFVKGDPTVLNCENLFLGVVGTRKPTAYGREVAKNLTRELVSEGCIIVSGLADGIDAAAHESCLDSGGATIGVLGCGVDVVYPASNRILYEKIIKQKGVVLSEFPPSQLVAKGLFISRNRIISGLSHGIIVVEGSEHSGALITARHAAEQGRDVFAVPSQITSPLSHASHLLIKQGAKLVSSSQDIFDEYSIVKSPSIKVRLDLTFEEEVLIKALHDKPKSVDDLIESLEYPAPVILRLITELEIKKVIYKDDVQTYHAYRNVLKEQGASGPDAI